MSFTFTVIKAWSQNITQRVTVKIHMELTAKVNLQMVPLQENIRWHNICCLHMLHTNSLAQEMSSLISQVQNVKKIEENVDARFYWRRE